MYFLNVSGTRLAPINYCDKTRSCVNAYTIAQNCDLYFGDDKFQRWIQDAGKEVQKREFDFMYKYLLTAGNDFCKLNLVILINPEYIKYVSSYITSSNLNVYSRFLQHYLLVWFLLKMDHACSPLKGQKISNPGQLNPGHAPETEDWPGKCRTVDHLSLYTLTPLWLHVECDTKDFKNHERWYYLGRTSPMSTGCSSVHNYPQKSIATCRFF